MSHKSKQRRMPVDMSVRELARLRLLNEGLLEAEHYVHRHTARILFDCFSTGGLTNANLTANALSDVEVLAMIHCVREKTHKGSDSTDSEVLATLDAGVLLRGRLESNGQDRTDISEGERNPLSGVHFCWLFRYLLGDLFDGDWTRLLEIGGLRAEVKLFVQIP